MRTELESATARLATAGIPNAQGQARALLAGVLNIEPADLMRRDPAQPLDSQQAIELAELVDKRIAGYPLQYLVGTAAFRYLDLAVGDGVFIPRPETEGLVDLVLQAMRPDARVIDLCAGSGAIALSIAHERSGAAVTAAEQSPEALVWLRRNCAAQAAMGDAEVQVVEIDVTAAGAASSLSIPGGFDVVVSNPPYVPSGVQVPAEVRHDPAQAVFAGSDGLDVIRLVGPLAAELLRAGGLLALEHDETHQAAVVGLVEAAGFQDVRGHDDLTGRPRYVTGIRRPRDEAVQTGRERIDL